MERWVLSIVRYNRYVLKSLENFDYSIAIIFNIDVGEVNVSEKTDRIDVNGKSIYAQKALEVDFIASKGDIKYYIQSALSMDDADKQLQEKRSLYYIDDSFKKIVVAKTGLKPSYDEKGVVIIDLFDFLMDKVEL